MGYTERKSKRDEKAGDPVVLDTFLEKPLSACEAATVTELDELVWAICDNTNPDTGRLARCIARREQDHVCFDKLRHLRIIGDEDKYTLEIFERYGITRGFYLNADATWLLLLLPEQAHPGTYLERCNDAVKSLSIRNSSMYALFVGTLDGLKQMHLENNTQLESVEGFFNLRVLEQLTINDCPKLREFLETDALWPLTKLTLSRCNSLTELDLSGCVSLTNLDLSGCESLTKLVLFDSNQLTWGHDLSSQLTRLNLSRCESLTKLDLSCCARLTELDLSLCKSLTELVLLDFDQLALEHDLSAQLTHLDLSGCESLTKLDLFSCDSLIKLDLSGCEILAELNLSGCDSLTELHGMEKLTRLTTLSLAGDESLANLCGLGDPAKLCCLEKLTQLTSLRLSECNRLITLCGFPTSLTRLDISECNNLTVVDLSGCNSLWGLELSECENLTELDFSGCTRLTNLDLFGCDGLKELDLSGCNSLARLDLSECVCLTKLELPGCTRLTNLYLSKCDDLKKLDLSECNSLWGLELSECESLTELFFYGCTCLTNLNLSGCDGLKELDLSGCNSLARLDLSECESLTELFFYGCTCLTNLNLSGCDGLKELDLSGCNSLARLDLSECVCLTKLELPGCTRLTNLNLSECDGLKELDLSGCKSLWGLELSAHENITELDLSGCDSLTWLDLSECEKLNKLHGLEQLGQLVELDVSNCGNLTELVFPECHIFKLDLSGCRSLAELKGLEKLKQLTELTLPEYSALTAIPDGIRYLPSLRRLDLRYMQLADLPDWLPEIAEKFTLDFNWSGGGTKAIVLLKGTKVEGVDMSIFNQPYEMVVKWFEERKAGRNKPLNELKVIFLGDGEAGKSYTISRLMNNGGDPVGYEGVRTPGIAIKNQLCKFNDRVFKVNYWDFGGQEIMHAMHRIFLTNRTMYVVLVSASDPNPIERARYWLRNIKSFAPEAPVLLVLNKIDIAPHVAMDIRILQTENSNLTQMVRMSSLEFNQQKFESEFRSVLLREIVNSGMLDVRWPKSWIDVKTRMENLGKYYITLEDYEQICEACQVVDVQKALLDWFNDLGISFCFRNNFRLENQVILEPRWITNGLYIILFNHRAGADQGMVSHRLIHDLLKRASKDTTIKCTDRRAEYKIPGDVEYVLGIMRQFGLSLQISDGTEFIPMLCNESPMLEVKQYEQDENVLEFHMVFEYLPNNVLHRLMVERYGELDTANVWKSGARFVPPGTGLSAVVAMDGDILKFYISHTDLLHSPNTYLTTLKAHVERILQKTNLQPSEGRLVYKSDGKRGIFDYEELEHNYANGNRKIYSSVWKKDINIADILDPFTRKTAAEESGTHSSMMQDNTDSIALLNAIRRSCQTMQDEPIYRLVTGTNSKDMEDLRNRRIRDDLGREGFNVTDQSQRGSGKTGRGIGEVDLMVRDSNNDPWTIIEALRVSNGTKVTWNNHLDKLIAKYNTRGYHVLYLLTYVDADPQVFSRILTGYLKYIQTYAPKGFTCCKYEILDQKGNKSPQYTRVAKCRYKCGDYTPTVYHIFARIPTSGE